MNARLQFALSLAFDFDVYISDEITAVGDAEFKKKAQKAFADLTGKSSLIMVSHGEGTLRQFCEAGIWIHEGKRSEEHTSELQSLMRISYAVFCLHKKIQPNLQCHARS